jgi:tetratricopeptide (TPR) repeat protein
MAQKANAGRALVLSESAAHRVKAGDLKTAIAELREAVSLDPESLGAYFLLASTLRQSSADLVEVTKTLRRVLELNPRHAPAHHQLGMALESQGKKVEAMAEFRVAVELAPGFIEARHALGKAAMEIKDWETAAAQFRGVIAWEPKDAAAHHQLSRALRAMGQTEESESELRAAQQLNPSLKTP